MPLFGYMQQTQRFLRDVRQDMFNPGDLTSYINRARREVAMRSESVRCLTPISGQVLSASVTNPGSGYVNPTLTITPPDFPGGTMPSPSGAQATAAAIVEGGTIAAIDITYGGEGYFQPVLTITDSVGTGATATLQITPINVLALGQEAYPFSAIDLSMFPGVASVFTIRSVAVIYANYRYVLPMYAFSEYQAKIRQYPYQYSYVPCFCSQYGQGTGGSFYAYPYPSQQYQWEFDCFGLPQDLITDQSVEAIPQPWTEAVPYFAAHLGYLEIQNWNAAEYYFKMFDKVMQRYSDYTRPGRITNPYGRY